MNQSGGVLKHDRHCYTRGCALGDQCVERRVDARNYMRARRAKLKARDASLGRLRSVPTVPDEVPTLPLFTPQPAERRAHGPVYDGMAAELAAIPDAVRARPGMAAAILALAGDIDCGDSVSRVSAMRELRASMAELRPSGVPSSEPSARDRFLAGLSAAL